MAFTAWQEYIKDDQGNILTGASVEVRKESDGTLATLYADSVGSGQVNPFNNASDGLARFYAAADTSGYKITVSHPSFASDAIFRNVPIGEAQNRDVGTDAADLLTKGDADALYSSMVQDNLTATTDPTVNDDSDDGYSAGSRWLNTVSDEFFLCLDATVGAANWQQATLSLDDLGSMATRNYGTAAAEHRDNSQNEAEFLAKPLTVTEIAGTSYTVTASDNGTMLKTTNASPVTITVPQVSTEDLDNGFQVIVQRAGDGEVTISPEGADVLNAADDFYNIDVKYGAASVVKETDGFWWMTGALSNTPLDGYDAVTGTSAKTAWTIYTAPTISGTYTQAEVQAIADNVQTLAERLAAVIEDLT